MGMQPIGKPIAVIVALAFILTLVVQPAWLFGFRPALDDSAVGHSANASSQTFSAVTFNLWRLCDDQRVPKIREALIEIQSNLANDDVNDQLPDVLLFQELECEATTTQLGTMLRATHTFDYAICGKFRNGEPRSGVGVAVTYTKFELLSVTELDLGQLWGDHRRCALHVVLRTLDGSAEIDIINVHHSPHPLKYPQTERLVAEFDRLGLSKRPFVLTGGDFNFAPNSRSHALVSRSFTDSMPVDRGKTHWLGGRIDLLFVNDGIQLLRPLDRSVAYRAIQPTKLFRPYYRCTNVDWDGCALSDHLSEGGLFALQP